MQKNSSGLLLGPGSRPHNWKVFGNNVQHSVSFLQASKFIRRARFSALLGPATVNLRHDKV